MAGHLHPSQRDMRAAFRASRDGAFNCDPPGSPAAIVAGVDTCRRCELWRDATQGVAGEGPARARMMIVGEQPGDQEDIAGRPLVGPAGQLLDKALIKAGAPRDQIFVTNAVKHFKHQAQVGKRRIHKTPRTGEVIACRWWLDHERRLVRPRVIVALGATAALSVFYKAMKVGDARGRAIQLPDQAQGVVTYCTRPICSELPDEEAKKAAWRAFVGDLRFAWGLVG